MEINDENQTKYSEDFGHLISIQAFENIIQALVMCLSYRLN